MIEIYLITNTINFKHYVGQTCNWTDKRWKEHLSDSKRKHLKFPLHKAINKYGPDAFTIEVLCIAKSQEEANDQEKHLIQQYCSMITDYGYNVASGGHNGNAFAGFSPERMAEAKAKMSVAQKGNKNASGSVRSTETRAKISVTLTGKRHSEETKAKMSASHKTPEVREKHRQNRLGKPLSEETKAKISAANVGKHHSEEMKAKMLGNKNAVGTVHSIETRAKMSAAKIGKHYKKLYNVIK